MKIDDIVPYERNARNNDKAVPVVAESIKEFGFKGAIVLNRESEGGTPENPVIVNGHTRVKAMKYLGWEEVPDEYIVYTDGLTEEEVKALRLADNRTGEVATWNKALLKSEVRALDKSGLDMSRFKFDWKSKKDGFVRGQEAWKTDTDVNLHLVDRSSCYGDLELPRLEPVDFVPTDMIPFNFAKSSKRFDCGIHFCIDDYQFERVWRNPERYLDLLSKFECVCTPDFSLYTNMPYPMKLWNRYRALALGKYWQDNGLIVIPDIVWSDDRSFDYCFEGIPTDSTVFLSMNGCQLEMYRDQTLKGLDEIAERLHPKRVLLMGNVFGHDLGGAEIVRYENNLIFKKG